MRIAHRLHTPRRALSHYSTERTCIRDKCPISNTKLCLRRNAVYQITCKNCNQHYIGSTARFIHDRIREHLKNNNSSVKKHISLCQKKKLQRRRNQDHCIRKGPCQSSPFRGILHKKGRNVANSRTFCFNFVLMIALILSWYISRNALF